jgi:riboflavin kinase / FMN adenylyltransferase
MTERGVSVHAARSCEEEQMDTLRQMWEPTVHRAGECRLSGSAVAIGAFDGVHLGHQKLINRMIRSSMELGVPSVVYTFDPPPKVYFGAAEPLICLDEKLDRIGALGVDHIIVAEFTAAFRLRSAEGFIAELSVLGPEVVWVGGDFRFGACKTGTPAMLGCYFDTHVLAQHCTCAGDPISSTLIRALKKAGDRKGAEELQGWRGFDFRRLPPTDKDGGENHV